jgi:xanthine/uracil permease
MTQCALPQSVLNAAVLVVFGALVIAAVAVIYSKARGQGTGDE